MLDRRTVASSARSAFRDGRFAPGLAPKPGSSAVFVSLFESLSLTERMGDCKRPLKEYKPGRT